jgi:hypothetical protein
VAECGAEARSPALGLAARLEHFCAEPLRRHLIGLGETGLLAAKTTLEAVSGDARALQHFLHAGLLVAAERRR